MPRFDVLPEGNVPKWFRDDCQLYMAEAAGELGLSRLPTLHFVKFSDTGAFQAAKAFWGDCCAERIRIDGDVPPFFLRGVVRHEMKHYAQHRTGRLYAGSGLDPDHRARIEAEAEAFARIGSPQPAANTPTMCRQTSAGHFTLFRQEMIL
jgi:hypothetical protein